MRHEKLTKGELAERFGVDVRTITNWVADGMPQRRESGRPVYAWPECYAWREEQIRNDARALRHAGGDQDHKMKAAELRLRQLELETENAELDLAERRGQLVPLEFMTSEFDRIAQGIRTSLLSLPQTWALRLGAATSTVERQMILQDAINEMMPQLRELVDSEEGDDVADGASAGNDADSSTEPGAEEKDDDEDENGEPPAAIVA